MKGNAPVANMRYKPFAGLPPGFETKRSLNAQAGLVKNPNTTASIAAHQFGIDFEFPIPYLYM